MAFCVAYPHDYPHELTIIASKHNIFLKPVKRWKGVRKALDFTPMCPQLIFPKDLIPLNYISENISEDCLNLNIWTPDIKPKKLKTVMVWIHGGAFLVNSANVDETDGQVLAAFGDVVVVTINYRQIIITFIKYSIT